MGPVTWAKMIQNTFLTFLTIKVLKGAEVFFESMDGEFPCFCLYELFADDRRVIVTFC